MHFYFFFTEIYAVSSNDIKVGTNIEVDGSPWRVLGIYLLSNIMFVILIIITND